MKLWETPETVRRREAARARRARLRELSAKAAAALEAEGYARARLETLKPGDWGYLWEGQKRMGDGFALRYSDRFGLHLFYHGDNRADFLCVFAKILAAAGIKACHDSAYSGACLHLTTPEGD